MHGVWLVPPQVPEMMHYVDQDRWVGAYKPAPSTHFDSGSVAVKATTGRVDLTTLCCLLVTCRPHARYLSDVFRKGVALPSKNKEAAEAAAAAAAAGAAPVGQSAP